MRTPRIFFREISDLIKNNQDDRTLLPVLEGFVNELRKKCFLDLNDIAAGAPISNTEIAQAVHSKLLDYLKYSDRKEGTLLDLAARSGHDRFFKKIVSLWGEDLSIEHIENAQTDSPEIQKSLNALMSLKKKKGSPNTHGLSGMVQLMNSLRSPARNIGVYSEEHFLSPNQPFRKAFRSPKGTIRTPGQTAVHTVCEIKILEPTVGHNSQAAQSTPSLASSSIHIVSEPEKAVFPRAIPHNISNAPATGVALPGKYTQLPSNKTQGFKFSINQNILDAWSSEPRTPNQNDTMGGYSANDIADLAGFDTTEGAFQWCHLAAHSMGGPDGQKPTGKAQYGVVGPQQSTNLVLGTEQANAHMLIFETSAKKLIEDNIVENLEIHLEPEFYPGLEHLHVANFLTYTLHDPTTDLSVSLKFDMLSRRQVSYEEIEHTLEVIIKKFHDRKKLNHHSGCKRKLF